MKLINKIFNQSDKSVLARFSVVVLLITSQSCSDYLDVVPDDLATLDKAFTLKVQAQNYLNTCYSYLPQDGNVDYNIAMLSGDEIWTEPTPYQINLDAIQIALGNQNISSPIQSVWDGTRLGGGPGNNFRLFNGIRQCNVFLEALNNSKSIPDLTDIERQRWIGEVEFLKAYYHFYLLRMYGPIPIIDTNVAIDAPDSEINVERQSVDDCVSYIVKTLDDAVTKLPEVVNPTLELGRANKTIALSIKAKVLLMAASPLFNGNAEMSTLKDKLGKPLFNLTYDDKKWKLAADAALEAINSAEANGASLYKFPSGTLSPTMTTQMSIRQAVCERANPGLSSGNNEIIWGNPNSLTTWGGNLQQLCLAPLTSDDGETQNTTDALKILSVPIKIAEMFYSVNGVPINEDKNLDFSNENALRSPVPATDSLFIRSKTARLNFDREPRFYADLGFDQGVWFKYDSKNPSKGKKNSEVKYYLDGKFLGQAGAHDGLRNNVTGYFIKKLVDWKSSVDKNVTWNAYPWPQIRLADLYLMYAEAKNEAGGTNAEVFPYIDMIRARAGLDGVVNSWGTYSKNGVPSNIETRRAIIHQERNIELAFEGQRYWDILRWKEAVSEFNQSIRGWNVNANDAVSYYQITTLYQQNFQSPRDYFWPIPLTDIQKNPNLVQNRGW